jgi:hypothetical protein
VNEHPFTVDITPFTARSNGGHELLVLAGVFELRRPWQADSQPAAMTFSTREMAEAKRDELAEAGIGMRLTMNVIDAIDYTAAIEANFGAVKSPGLLAMYRNSWCGRVDQTLPRRRPMSGAA